MLSALWLTLICCCIAASGCALRPQVKRVCLDVEASERLNFYEGNSHSISLFVYGLSDPRGFEAASAEELLVGHLPAGVIEPPVLFTIAPATQRRVEQIFPEATKAVGVLADYHRPLDGVLKGEDGKGLRGVVPARCGFFTPEVKLSESRLERG